MLCFVIVCKIVDYIIHLTYLCKSLYNFKGKILSDAQLNLDPKRLQSPKLHTPSLLKLPQAVWYYVSSQKETCGPAEAFGISNRQSNLCKHKGSNEGSFAMNVFSWNYNVLFFFATWIILDVQKQFLFLQVLPTKGGWFWYCIVVMTFVLLPYRHFFVL